MLRIDYYPTTARCDGVSRRAFIQASALGWAGLSLGRTFASPGNTESYVRGKSVVFLFLGGGPSQL